MRRGNREVESLLEAPSGWGVRIEYYGQRKWTFVTAVNLNKPKELWGLNQKVSGWFGTIAEGPTRTILPPVDRMGLRYSLSITRNVVTSCLRPLGQANRKACCGRYGERWRKVSLKQIQMLLGHSNLTTTERYIYSLQNDLKLTVEVLSEIKRHETKKRSTIKLANLLILLWRPQGDLNPCCRRERLRALFMLILRKATNPAAYGH
jgi:hypothetical protein